MTRSKPFTMIAVLIFAVIALVHLYRVVHGHFTVVVGSHTVGTTASIVAAVVAALLAVMVYRESKS
jgi:multisubunit Na+/H+ antiporter MnhF subunit